MFIGDLCKVVAQATGVGEQTVAMYARVLREAGLLTTGARGVNAPHMKAIDAARLLIAMMATEKPSRAASAVFGLDGFKSRAEKIIDSKTAGIIADADITTLNEEINKGICSWAPKTTQGAKRMFSEIDVTCLALWSSMRKEKYTRTHIDFVVSGVRSVMSRSPEAREISLIYTFDGGKYFLPSSEFDGNFDAFPGGIVRRERRIEISALRQYIAQRFHGLNHDGALETA